jgi:predicted outer membrane repeat protein
VAAGTYTGEGNKNLDFGGTDLVLVSEAGPELTIIDCEGSGRGFHFHSGETVAAVVEGFTITNGYITAQYPDSCGGGMYCGGGSSPTVRGCTFSENTADHGGGMGCDESSPTVSNCDFIANLTSFGGSIGGGGGMWCWESSPTVSHCDFIGNSAEFGGGMSSLSLGYYERATVSNCTFSENSGYWGGGICGNAFTTVSDCIISENSGYWGGGMYRSGPDAAVINCTFLGNIAEADGGGMFTMSASYIDTQVSSCTFYENTAYRNGGGISCHTIWPVINSCTFYGNSASSGGGIYSGYSALPFIENTIIAFGLAGGAIGCGGASHEAILTCCNIFGNAGGDWVGEGCYGEIADQYGVNGNFSACPSFCNAEGGDFTLCDESPCLPGNHPDAYDCGLIGAWGQGCSCGPSATGQTSWGSIKAMYR